MLLLLTIWFQFCILDISAQSAILSSCYNFGNSMGFNISGFGVVITLMILNFSIIFWVKITSFSYVFKNPKQTPLNLCPDWQAIIYSAVI